MMLLIALWPVCSYPCKFKRSQWQLCQYCEDRRERFQESPLLSEGMVMSQAPFHWTQKLFLEGQGLSLDALPFRSPKALVSSDEPA